MPLGEKELNTLVESTAAEIGQLNLMVGTISAKIEILQGRAEAAKEIGEDALAEEVEGQILSEQQRGQAILSQMNKARGKLELYQELLAASKSVEDGD